MVARPLTRWGGLAAALAGVLGIGLALVFPIAYALLGLETSQQVVAWTATVQTPVKMALCLSWLLQMAGLVGVQTRQAASSRPEHGIRSVTWVIHSHSRGCCPVNTTPARLGRAGLRPVVCGRAFAARVSGFVIRRESWT